MAVFSKRFLSMSHSQCRIISRSSVSSLNRISVVFAGHLAS